jgi:hypothetical protein
MIAPFGFQKPFFYLELSCIKIRFLKSQQNLAQYCVMHELYVPHCILISCNELAIKRARELGMPAILFEPNSAYKLMNELKVRGILNSELNYFIPPLFEQSFPIIQSK